MTKRWKDETVTESFPVSILGVPIGMVTGWDEMDHLDLYLYGFQPFEGINLNAGDLGVNYDTGLFQYYNDQGEVVSSVRIYDVIKGVLG